MGSLSFIVNLYLLFSAIEVESIFMWCPMLNYLWSFGMPFLHFHVNPLYVSRAILDLLFWIEDFRSIYLLMLIMMIVGEKVLMEMILNIITLWFFIETKIISFCMLFLGCFLIFIYEVLVISFVKLFHRYIFSNFMFNFLANHRNYHLKLSTYFYFMSIHIFIIFFQYSVFKLWLLEFMLISFSNFCLIMLLNSYKIYYLILTSNFLYSVIIFAFLLSHILIIFN